MSFIYNIIFLPIESIVEFVFCFVLSKFSRLGVAGAIVAVSIAVNFLALPLYNMADALQLKERNLQNKMQYWVKHIKKTFKGDEQFMMLNAYYRLNDYHPIYALRSSISILIEIPFFIAAYHFLSNCSLLEGESILFLRDLGEPDRLFKIASLNINVLPILMTLINVVSTAVYTKGAPLREKLQTYCLALIFLGLLYNSPSGLVFYWILNNLFSLAKNIVLKMKHPKMIVWAFLGGIFLLGCVYVTFFMPFITLKKQIISYIFTICFLLCPIFAKYLKNPLKKFFESFEVTKYSLVSLFFSCITIFLLCGLILPSNVVATSPIEFAFLGDIDSPLKYISHTLCFFFGFFVFWPFCIYKLFGKNVKSLMPPLFFVFALISLLNVFVFKYNYGNINVFFNLDVSSYLINNSFFYSMLPILVFLLLGILFTYIFRKFPKVPPYFVFVFSFALLILGIKNIKNIKNEMQLYSQNNSGNLDNKIEKEFTLSKNGKNIVVLFLDKAVSSYVPYVMEQFPELRNTFSGFELFENTVSFGSHTVLGSSAMMGGYEYTPDRMNEQPNRLLVDKHNEALNVMPKLFSENGFKTTFIGTPLPNYREWDLTVFEQTDSFKISPNKNYLAQYKAQASEKFGNYLDSDLCKKNIVEFSVLQILYPPLRVTFYNDGKYYTGLRQNISSTFLKEYAGLFYLKDLYNCDDMENTFTFIQNQATHEYTYLIGNELKPGLPSDEVGYSSTGIYEPVTNETIGTVNDKYGYYVNASALLQVGNFLNSLKKNDVYDNTRIIIVSDHGSLMDIRRFKDFEDGDYIAGVNCLLMVKDFNAKDDFRINESFHTNADTINFAAKGFDKMNRNPITGNEFMSVTDFNRIPCHAVRGVKWKGDTLRSDKIFEFTKDETMYVSDNIFDPASWTK